MAMIIASPYTRLFWNEYQLNPNRTDYHVVIDQTISGKLNINRLSDGLEKFIEDHILFNSHLIETDNNLFWQKNKEIYRLQIFDLTVKEKKFIKQPFNLGKGPLYRFGLFKKSKDQYDIILILHHVLLDGASIEDSMDFMDLISHYYNHPLDRLVNLSEQAKRIQAVNKLLLKKVKFIERQGAKYYWYHCLKGLPVKNELPHVYDQKKTDKLVSEYRFRMDNSDMQTNVAKNLKTTWFTILSNIWGILIVKYCNNQTAHICYPLSIKEAANFIYGGQINTVILPIRFEKDLVFREFIEQANVYFKSHKIDNSHRYSYLPIDQVIAYSPIQCLNVAIAQNNLKDKTFNFRDCKLIVNKRYNMDIAGAEILLECEKKKDGFDYRILFRADLFSPKFIQQLAKHFQHLLHQIIRNPDIRLSELSLLTPDEYKKIIYDWNQTDRKYPKDKTITKIFEQQVSKTPDSIAVIYEGQQLTYKELNEQSNQLARYLKKIYLSKTRKNFIPDTLVSICLERSLEMIVAILGILKAGGAYVPIDPSSPKQQISYMLRDSQTKVLLIQYHLETKLAAFIDNKKIQYISIDRIPYNKEEKTNLNTQNQSTDLAYVIYTSGTTGKPKGTMLEHRGLVNLAYAQKENLKITQKTRILQYASVAFDAAVWEIFSALLFGAQLFILSEKVFKEKVTIIDYIDVHKINIATFPPALLKAFLHRRLSSLKILILAGDICPKGLINDWKKDRILINAYGPTESTVCTTIYEYRLRDSNNNIGRPLPNLKIYILNSCYQPVSIGIIGELYISGIGLARGYLNKPDLTKEKFIVNPFATDIDKINGYNYLYKTGDLVRWLVDGNIEYIGRNDRQIKICGHRIELGDIENKLMDYPKVEHAVVIHKSDDKREYLLAYYVADKKLDSKQLMHYLVTLLPNYMLPRAIIYLEKIPLTVNGKIDYKALPSPRFQSINHIYLAPVTEAEKIICAAFAKVLKLDKISINDDFFELGGDSSLLAITLTSSLQINFIVKVADIFALRTPRRLAANLTWSKNNLVKRLKKIKQYYKKETRAVELVPAMQAKLDAYLQETKNLTIKKACKPIKTILLTGSTGFLGSNLLHYFLVKTNYKIIVLVRDINTKTAWKRLSKIFFNYFDKELDDYKDQLKLYLVDLEKDDLSMGKTIYQRLVKKVDSIIHAAALVKHYGNYDTFYSANVQATINLLEFCKQTRQKDFHYMSTYSVLQIGKIMSGNGFCTENDMPNDIDCYNAYVKTKLQGEQQVLTYRKFGINGNIYRLGNLAFISENYKVQINVKENAFANWLRALVKLKCIAKPISKIELSPVNDTASAIIHLFDKSFSCNSIYHVFNPYFIDVDDMLHSILSVKIVKMNTFVDHIINYLKQHPQDELVSQFISRHGWLEDQLYTLNKVLQNKTQKVLEFAGFTWHPITIQDFMQYFKSLHLYRNSEVYSEQV